MWKLGRNEIAREQDEIVPPDLGIVGYIISIRSPGIRTDYTYTTSDISLFQSSGFKRSRNFKLKKCREVSTTVITCFELL